MYQLKTSEVSSEKKKKSLGCECPNSAWYGVGEWPLDMKNLCQTPDQESLWTSSTTQTSLAVYRLCS